MLPLGQLSGLLWLLLLFPQPRPAQPAEHFFSSDGVRLHYLEQGRGEVIVLLHGFSRDSQMTWVTTGLFAALAERNHVLALDCRGHGRSQKPHEEAAYGATMVEDVRRLLDHLKVPRAHLVGYSMGGRIALKFAAVHPDRAHSVTLIGAGGARESDDHSIWDEVADAWKAGEGNRPLLEFLFPPGSPTRPSDEQLEAMNQQAMAANEAVAMAAVARSYREFATSEEDLAAIAVPVLAIIGERDPVRPDVERLKASLPSLKVSWIKEADHVTTLQQTACVEAIKELVAKADPEGR